MMNIPGLQFDNSNDLTSEDMLRQQLAQQNPSTGTNYSLPGFVGNALSDAGNIVKSLPGLGKLAWDVSVPGMAIKSLMSGSPSAGIQQAGSDVANVGKGVFNEYKDLATNPVNHVYQTPLSSILDVLPATKLLDVGKAGEAAKAAELADASQTPAVASKLYSSAFGVTPSQAKYLKPLDTFNEMMAHGVSGGYKDISAMVNKVTGANGALPRLVRQAVSAIPGEINVLDVPGMISEQLAQIPGLTDRNVEAHMNAINKMLKTGQSETVGGIHPLDALDAIKQLQAKAAEFYHKPPTELTHSLGDAYSSAANELRDRLDSAANASNAVAPNADAIAKELSTISPRLAQQFAAKPTVGTLRSIQAPFVRMGQILDSTAAGATSKSSQLVHTLNRGLLAAGGMATGGIPGAVASQLAEPLVSAGVESVLPKVMTTLGTAAANAGQTAGKLKGGLSLPNLELGRLPSLSGDATPAPAFAATPGQPQAATTSAPQWQVSSDGQYKTDPATGQSYSLDEQWKFDPTSNQWVPNQTVQQSQSNGLPSIQDIEAAMVNDLKTTGGVQMPRLSELLQAAQYQQSQYGGEVQAGTIATKNALGIAQQAAQMFLGAGANPQTGEGGQGGLVNTKGGTGVVSGTLRQLALTLGGKNTDSAAANYNTWADNASTQIAAALNGGYDKVTAENKKVARNLLPNLTDSSQTAAQKINQIMLYLNQAQQNYYGSTPAQLQQQSAGLPPVNQMLGGQ